MSTNYDSVIYTLFNECYPYYGQCTPDQVTLECVAAELKKTTEPNRAKILKAIIKRNH